MSLNTFTKILALILFALPSLADTPPTVFKVNGKIGNVVLTTSDISEGSNLYYTSGRFNSALATKTTSDIAEGSNLYYTPARFNSAFSAKSTTDLTEGSNLYYTSGRFDSAFSGKTTSNLTEGSNLYFTNARVDTEFDTRLATKSTTNLSEGSNLYFTNGRAQSAISATSPLTYSTGVVGCQTASGSLAGCLSSADWTTFNSKQAAGNYITALTGDVVASGPGSAASTISTGAVTDAKGSLANKPAVTVVATTNQALSGLPIVDGFQTVANSMVLLTAQSTGSQNGPWVAAAGAWSRPTWYPSGGTTQAFQFITTLIRLGSTYSGTVWRNTTAAPITIDTTATTWVITKITLNASTATKATISTDGFLSSSDWSTFNNKLDKTSGNYITNSDAEVNTTGWNLYNNAGRTVPAAVTTQDITYTSALSGNAGNGATVSYTFCGSSYIGPVVTCPTGTSVQVCWYNGPTLAQNPTATVLKAAYDAQSCATAIATSAITGTASNKQYITGTATLANGGDTSPTDGTAGSVTGVTFTRNTSTPLIGIASFDLGKDANSRQGTGVSTDFTINSVDKNTLLQISFVYSGSSGMVLGSSSDARVFVYDIANATLIPVSPRSTITGPVSTAKTFVGTFTSTTSASYRLIVHIATTSATAWDLLLDSVMVNDQVTASAATQVPSVVLQGQPINGSVTDHMVVMWRDGTTQWVPATVAGAAIPVFGTDTTMLGFATNIVGSTADVYVHGFMDGFSFGPFLGYEQYIDTTAGNISPLPSPFTDLYVRVGKGVTSTGLNIDFSTHVDQISNGSGVPVKGGILTATSANDGTGDVVVAAGTTGQFLRYNTGLANGFGAFTPVGTAPIVYTASTSAWSCAVATGSVAGCLAAADFTTFNNKAATASPTFTGTPTLPTGTIGVTQTAGNSTTALATTAFVTTADNLKANLASPTFTGTPSLPTGTTGVTQAAADSTTALATTAFVTTADNLKANLASPTFSGTPSLPTGTTGVTQTAADSTTKLATTAFVTTADNLKANLASPTFSGTPSLPTGTTGVTQTAGNSTTALATTAFVTTADNLKANIATPTLTGDVTLSTGNLLISTIGKGPQVKTGTNAKIGQATLVAGTVTVANTSVTANSRIFLTVSTAGGTQGNLRTTKSAGTSFTITSTNAAETSVVDWYIVESIP